MVRTVISTADIDLISGWTVLKEDHTPHSFTGTTGGDRELTRWTLPGGSMGPNGILRITPLFSLTNNANNKTLRIGFGGSGGGSGTQIYGDALTTNASQQLMIQIWNRNSASSQVSPSGGASGFGSVSRVVVTGAKNTALDQDIVFTCTLAVASDVVTLESYMVEVLYGA